MAVIVNSRRDFTLENYRQVAADGEGVVIGDIARRVMAQCRASFVELLAADRTAFMYGVTSRPGLEVKVAVAPEDQAAWATGAEMLGTGRGFGGGYLDERVVRGIVFARLADFVEGTAKIRPIVADRVAAVLDGPLPAVPLDGQVGAGEILPLMHVMSRVVTSDFEEGEWMTLVNGSPCSAALIADTALHARHRLERAEQVLALSVEALRAPLDAYDPELDGLWGDEDETAALRALRGQLAGADAAGRLVQQAPVSYRILPRLLGQVHRAVAGVEHAARVSLASAAHNPVYVPPDDRQPHGRLFSTGGYHNAMAYPALNALTVAWADLALVAERHIACLHSSEVSELPHFLAPPGAPGAATNLFGWVATGYVEGARAAAAPTLLPACVNDARDDVSSPTFLAYAKERRGAECLDGVLAILALVSSQALFVADRAPAPRLRDFLGGLRSVFPPVDGRRRASLGAEAGRLAELMSRGALSGELDFGDGARSSAGRRSGDGTRPRMPRGGPGIPLRPGRPR
jgi:histidine ammonia-lyase